MPILWKRALSLSEIQGFVQGHTTRIIPDCQILIVSDSLCQWMSWKWWIKTETKKSARVIHMLLKSWASLETKAISLLPGASASHCERMSALSLQDPAYENLAHWHHWNLAGLHSSLSINLVLSLNSTESFLIWKYCIIHSNWEELSSFAEHLASACSGRQRGDGKVKRPLVWCPWPILNLCEFWFPPQASRDLEHYTDTSGKCLWIPDDSESSPQGKVGEDFCRERGGRWGLPQICAAHLVIWPVTPLHAQLFRLSSGSRAETVYVSSNRVQLPAAGSC